MKQAKYNIYESALLNEYEYRYELLQMLDKIESTLTVTVNLLEQIVKETKNETSEI